MTSLWDVRQKQRAVIEFLVLKGKPPINIFKRLENIYAALFKSDYPGLKVKKKIQV